jgi:hypothetical protein
MVSMSTATQTEAEEYRSTVAGLRRVDFTGTIWLGASIIAVMLPLSALLGQGWRPSDLPAGAGLAWWFGAILVTGGIVALAYAGCPVMGASLEGDERIKSVAIRLGAPLLGFGGVIAMLAVLLSPAR